MTRKDYTLLANTLRVSRPAGGAGYGVWRRIVEDLADDLAEAYSNFDGARFIEACES